MGIIACLTVIICSGYYFSVTDKGVVFSIIALIACISLLFYKFLNSDDIGIRKDRIYFAGYYIILVLIMDVVMTDMVVTATVKHILIIICALLIASIYSWEDFKDAFVKAMIIISICGLIGHMISFTSLINSFPLITNFNGVNHVHGLVFSVIKYANVYSPRLQGVMWEPGLFASYLAIAIVFCEEKTKKWLYYLTLALFVLCLILTRSGAGIIMMPVLLAIKFLQFKNIASKSLGVNVVILTIIVGGLVLISAFGDWVINWLNEYLFSKLFDSDNVSNTARINSVITDFKIWWKFFPFGCGIGNYATQVSIMSVDYTSATSTITSYLAQYGVFGIPIVAMLVKSIISIVGDRGFIAKIGTIILFVFILSKEPHFNLLFMNLIIMYGAFRKRRNNEPIKKIVVE